MHTAGVPPNQSTHASSVQIIPCLPHLLQRLQQMCFFCLVECLIAQLCFIERLVA